ASGLGDGADLAESGLGAERVGEAVEGGEPFVVEDRALGGDDEVDGGDDAAGVVVFDHLEPGAGVVAGGQVRDEVERLAVPAEAGGGDLKHNDGGEQCVGGPPSDGVGNAVPPGWDRVGFGP